MFDPHVKRRINETIQFAKNWEADISDVMLVPCERDNDPLGYQAVFFTAEQKRNAASIRDFTVGASHLVPRLASLKKAGYDAPMTKKAITLLEEHLGTDFFNA